MEITIHTRQYNTVDFCYILIGYRVFHSKFKELKFIIFTEVRLDRLSFRLFMLCLLHLENSPKQLSIIRFFLAKKIMHKMLIA